jgi:hypothetical protein
MVQENIHLRCHGKQSGLGSCHRGPPGSSIALLRLQKKYALIWESPKITGNGRGISHSKQSSNKPTNINKMKKNMNAYY